MTVSSERRVFITTSFAGLHHWPKAPEAVSFLRTPHRHIFHVRAELAVYHDDRDIEFIMVKTELNQYLDHAIKHFPLTFSCEQMAEHIAAHLDEVWGQGRTRQVEVSEDGENGAVVRFL